MKVKFLGFKKDDGTRGACRIKGQLHEPGKIYEVDDGLGNWMISRDLAVKVEEAEEEVPEVFVEEKPSAPMPLHVTPSVEKPKITAYDKLLQLTEGHLAEIYGTYGTGKSRLVHHIALEAQNTGKKVIFIDTEGGLLDEHVRQLENYWYVGDSIEALEDAVSQAKEQREKYDLLIVDSVGHPVYVNYVELGSMDQKLKAYQRLALIFRDMVRFARGERGKDIGKRKALAIAINHPVSEFARIAKDLPETEPLDPFGGAIHRVPKVILRCEPVDLQPERSVFRLLSFKLRGMAKNIEVAKFTINNEGVKIDWKI